jgi:regulator of sigma E protease
LDWYLIAAAGDMLGTALVVVEVAVALGLVIFVHELGHFMVAKLCGVKCEKFYLGFDIFGLKLLKFRWGETEYGIGILPLGGYVKMLGQEDNPARLREEIDRARHKPGASPEAADAAPDEAAQEGPAGETVALAAPGSDDPPETPDAPNDVGESTAGAEEQAELRHAEQALYDPRSYLAKSVPKRMAIISAGVVMNLIFAFVVATVAYRLGVRQYPCSVGNVLPGMTAWQVGLRPDDQIVEIGGKKMYRFLDMKQAVTLGDLEHGLPIVIRRPGHKGEITLTVKPDESGGMPMIGVTNQWTTTLVSEQGAPAVVPGSAAAKANPPLRPGDRIVKIDGHPVADYGQIHSYLAAHAEKTLTLTVERKIKTKGADGAVAEQLKTLDVELPPNPMRRLGLVMAMGPVTAVQVDSPAAKAGIRAGDRLLAIDRKPVGDPMTLSGRLRDRAGQAVTLTVQRPDGSKVEKKLTLGPTEAFYPPENLGSPVAVPALGVAYTVPARVAAVTAGSPAAKAGMKPGDQIAAATVIPPEDQHDASFEQQEQTLEFSEKWPNWPPFLFALQETLPGTTVKLAWKRGEASQEATLTPDFDSEWFNPSRGLNFKPVEFIQTAESWPEAAAWGFDETTNATLLVYRSIEKFTSRQISPRMMAGPIGIIKVAAHSASQGFTDLLIFLVVLSANLAVLNFLPIPLLDGGHIVFLAYEGIRGKPADERVQAALTYLGLFLLLTLMLWVFGLDLGLISRQPGQ